ncbi:hypothetical protein V8F33_007965 [Rhypophila sp. PSN 637]
MNASAPPIGAAIPPPGVTPNFDNPSESLAKSLIITSLVWPAATFIIICIRVFTCRQVLRKWHADDYLILVALVLALANSIICVIQTNNGAGRHMWDVRAEALQRFLKLGITGGSLTFNLSTLFIKLSILTFFLRFPTERAFRLTTYALMVVVVGYCIATAFSFIYHCTPMQSGWDFTVHGECVDLYAAYLAPSAINVATDIIILFMPVWLLWPLRVGPMKKLGVALIMMTGGFVAAVSIVRLDAIISYSKEADMTWYYCINLMWCIREMYTGIICACLPCLRPFTKHFFPNSFLFSTSLEHRLRSVHLYGSNPISWVVRDKRRRGSQRLEEIDDVENSVGLRETRRDDGERQHDKDAITEETPNLPSRSEPTESNSQVRERRTSGAVDVDRE